MDRNVWRCIVQSVRHADRTLPRVGRRCRFSDALIVLMYLWSVWHDRPLSWASDRRHYGELFRPRVLPSNSQFCKRLKSDRCHAILNAVHDHIARSGSPGLVCFLDGKPLPVGECTKDKDARTGRGVGKFSRGYKLHAFGTHDGRIVLWQVTPLNVGEQPVAEHLMRHARHVGLVLADGNYDSAALYRQIRSRGGHLFTPLKGRSRDPRALAKMPAARRQSIDLWDRWPDYCRWIGRKRGGVERIFANATSFGGGLGPLPAWVRTLPRVRRWVGAKLIIYHARLATRRGLAA